MHKATFRYINHCTGNLPCRSNEVGRLQSGSWCATAVPDDEMLRSRFLQKFTEITAGHIFNNQTQRTGRQAYPEQSDNVRVNEPWQQLTNTDKVSPSFIAGVTTQSFNDDEWWRHRSRWSARNARCMSHKNWPKCSWSKILTELQAISGILKRT